MPAAAAALAEHNLQADEVEASGPGGRLLKEDVLRYVAEQGPARPVAAPSASAPPASSSLTVPPAPLRNTRGGSRRPAQLRCRAHRRRGKRKWCR